MGALRNCSNEVWNSKRESYQFANYSGGGQKYTCSLNCSTQSYSKKTSMPGADRREMQENQLLNHTADKEQRPLPVRSNCAGNLSQREKKLQEAICVLLVELCERFTFFGIVCNMILFCTVKLGYRNYQAAIVNMCFVGTSMLTPVLVGWLAEYLVGRIKLVCICMFLHFLGR